MSNAGNFVWFELMTTDVEGAVAFYTKVLDWTISENPDSPRPYPMFTAGELRVGAAIPLPEPAQAMNAPANWVGYVEVTDIDEVAEGCIDAGGQVIQPPMQMGGVGELAILADPQGGVLAAYQPEVETRIPEWPMPHGALGWAELATTDVASAKGFYGSLFGWHYVEGEASFNGAPYALHKLTPEGPSMGGVYPKPEQMPLTAWLYYIAVDDLDAALARVSEHGGATLAGPFDVSEELRAATCVDPQGAAFGLMGK